jgi:hypothetical protein
MGRIDQLARRLEDHISLPWQQHLTASEKTIFIIYPKEEERRLRARRDLFRQACERAGRQWHPVDLDPVFPDWMMSQDYATDYFACPDDLRQKLDQEFPKHVASVIRKTLAAAGSDSVVALFGTGTLFGFTHVSSVLKHLEGYIPGRLAVFFPGSYDGGVYRLLDARDGWGYMAIPITLHDVSHL